MKVDADSLGEYLRRERELQRVSLQDISAATKVQLTFLQALELDQYDRLPPTPFVTGFLRAYAECLNLDSEEIIAVYHERYGSSESPRGYRLPVAYRVKRSKHVSWKGVGLALVIMVLIVGLAWRTLKRGQDDATPLPSRMSGEQRLQDTRIASETVDLATETRQPEPVSTPEVSLPVQTITPVKHQLEQPVDTVTASVPLAPSLSESALPEPPAEPGPPPKPSEPLVLQAIAIEDTWLRVDIDGDERHALLLSAGKRAQWKGSERFVLKIGNARGTRLTLNGRDVPLPPTQDNVVRNFVLTREVLN